MSNKKSFKQLAKRILALTLAVMLMNSTIAYLTPSEVVLAGETTDTITRVAEEPTNPDEQDYDGSPFVLSTVNGEDFTWTGSGEATIVYYTDSECNTQTGVSDAVGSGATSDGGAPVNAGTYYAKISTAGDETYAVAELKQKITINKVEPAVSSVMVTSPETIYTSTALNTITLSGTATGVTVSDSPENVGGSIALDVNQTLTEGENSYNWIFTPNESAKNYKNATGTITLTVNEDTLQSISLGAESVTKNYSYGDAFSTENLAVTANYVSGATNTIQLNDENLSFTTNVEGVETTNLTCSVTKIIVTYMDKTAEIEINVGAKTVNDPTIELETAEVGYIYCGEPIKPAVVSVKDGEKEIPESEYTVSYSNNTAAGTATVTIADAEDGNYTVSGSTTFTIKTREVTVEAGTYKVSKEYDGTASVGTATGELAVSGILPADSTVKVGATPSVYTTAACQENNADVALALSGTGYTNYTLAAESVSVPYIITQAELVAVPGESVKAAGNYGAKLSELTVSGLTAKYRNSETSVAGTWKVRPTAGDIKPGAGHSQTYTVVFTPTAEAGNYKELTYVNVPVEISKAAGANLTGTVTGSYKVVPDNEGKVLFEINPITSEDGIVEYSMDGDGNGTYQDSNVFANLDPMTTGESPAPCSHTFYARVKADSNHNAGAAINSDAQAFAKLTRTDKPTLNYTITKDDDTNTYTVTITTVEGAEYSIVDNGNETNWSETNSASDIASTTSKNIAIRYADTDIYNASEAVTATVSGESKPQQPYFHLINGDLEAPCYNVTYGDEEFRIAVVAEYTEDNISFVSSNTDVATVEYNAEKDRGFATIKGVGKTTITVTVEETDEYAKTSKSFDLIVAKKDLRIKVDDITIYVGEPWYAYTLAEEAVTVNGDTINWKAKDTVPDYASVGVYDIIPYGCIIKDSTNTHDRTNNYNIEYVNGKFTILLDDSSLIEAISDAKDIRRSVVSYTTDKEPSEVANGTKYVTEAVMNTFSDAIYAAESILSNQNATTTNINEGVAELNAAIATFNATIKTGTKQSGNSGSSGYVDTGTSAGTTETPKTDTPKDETPATNNVEVSEGAAVYTPEVKVDKDGVASMSISTDELTSILDDMLTADTDNKVDTFEVAASTTGADSVSLSLAGEALGKLSNDTELSLSVKTDKGDMLIPNELLGELSNVAKKMKLQLDIAQAKEEDLPKGLLENANLEFAGAAKFEITAGDRAFTKFGDTPITVSMPVPKDKKLPKNPMIITISNDGITDYIKGTVEGQRVSALAYHFSTFVVTTYDYAEYEKDLGQITFNDAPVSLYVGGNTGKTVTPYKAGDAVVVAKSKTDSKKPVVILSVTADKKGIVNINKEGKLTAKKAGKVNVTYEFVNEKGIKANYKVAVTVKKASVKFVKKAATIEKGTKQTFKVKLEGYKKNSVTWITAKKNRAEVAENKGKLSVRVKGVTKGADTIYIVVAGKKVAKTKVQVVASK